MNLFNAIIFKPIFNLLLVIYGIIPGGNFGVAIIILTILIRLLLWPVVKKQLRQSRAMAKMQPELKRIQTEAKGNKQLEGVMMMNLYKEYKINPFQSIIITIIQLPIFIALYQVVQIFTLSHDHIRMYTYGFLQNVSWISSIIKNPSNLNNKLFGFINVTGHAINFPLNGIGSFDIILILLAAASAVTQYIVTKQTMPVTGSTRKIKDIMKEAADGKEPNQAEMNEIMSRNMMKFIPLFTFWIMINLPGALALYYTVSNLCAMVQQHFILKHDENDIDNMIDKNQKKKNNQLKTKPVSDRVKSAKEAKVIHIVAHDDKKGGK